MVFVTSSGVSLPQQVFRWFSQFRRLEAVDGEFKLKTDELWRRRASEEELRQCFVIFFRSQCGTLLVSLSQRSSKLMGSPIKAGCEARVEVASPIRLPSRN